MPRRSKGVLPGKRYPLNMRTTKELRDKIEAAARQSGLSLVQEVERRLERSFQREDQQQLMEQAATTALERAGFPIVSIGARDKSQAEPTKPADANQKDKES